LCPGWFPQDDGQIDRDDVPAKIERGFYDCIASDIRAFGNWMPLLERCPSALALIDGEDRPVPIRPGRYVVFRRETDGTDYSIPLPMALPEEVFKWIASYDDQPKTHSVGFLGSTHDGARKRLVQQLAAHYPDGLFSASQVPSLDNPLPEGRFDRDTYYRELQKCRIVLSLAGAGEDTFRFWENAACNAIHVAQRFALMMPHEFVESQSILRFNSIAEALGHIERILRNREAYVDLIAQGRLNLYRHHLTSRRASYFIEKLLNAFE
jgi:Glycosyl transferases group 1